MKWSYVQVYTVYVSQTYDLCTYFDHFNTILIFFDTNFKQLTSIRYSARYLHQIDSKVRHVIWTSFQNKSCLEGLNTDARDIRTRLHSPDITNDRWINEFLFVSPYFDVFFGHFHI